MRRTPRQLVRSFLPGRARALVAAVGRAAARRGPRLVRLERGDGATDLTLEGLPAGEEVRLVMVGRRDGTRRAWPVSAGTVRVVDDELVGLTRQRTDAFVETVRGSRVRRRPVRSLVDVRLPETKRPTVLWSVSADRRLGTRTSPGVAGAPWSASARRAELVEELREGGAFDEEYYRAQVPDLPDDADPIAHYLTTGSAAGLRPSRMFDGAWYRRANPGIGSTDPFVHWCSTGFRDLRDPSPEFDTWWYRASHMDPADGTNPLAHHRREGTPRGLSTRPSPHLCSGLGDGEVLPADRPVRRVCLFAGHDPDGLVDDHVVAYVRELARFADVYYLADREAAPEELARLEPYVRGAWGVPHEEGALGSHHRLLGLVGWDEVAGYDELLLVDDSAYLLRPLDEVFARMATRAADWWGLEASVALPPGAISLEASTVPIAMDRVLGGLLDDLDAAATQPFQLSPYFLALRRSVTRDPAFRRYLEFATCQEPAVARACAARLTRWLVRHGHRFDTFLAHLYPHHPLHTRWYVTVLDRGFPLLLRDLLTENPQDTPALWTWRARVRAAVPGADLRTIDAHLVRTTSPDARNRAQHLGTSRGLTEPRQPARLLTTSEFVEFDRATPKRADWWAFPVCAFTEAFSGNERAVFEEVKDDPTIRKIVLTRGREVHADGLNVDVVPLESALGQYLLAQSGVVLIKHTVARNVVHPISPALHNIVQVWHGIPYKRISYASEDFLGRLDWLATECVRYRGIVAASRLDAAAMATAFYPRTLEHVWVTGLPRNDFILRPEDRLPDDLRQEAERLRSEVAGRRLVLYMPTFRNAQGSASYTFTDEQLVWLRGWLEANDAVLGVREHMADKARTYSTQFRSLPMIDLSDTRYGNPEILYRESSALITDYSSAFIDYMMTGRPAVSFAYDYHAYQRERGGYYDLESIFPGPIARDFGQLQQALDGLLEREPDDLYRFRRGLLMDHVDDASSARVVARIKALDGIGTWPGEGVA